jgi:hypothetical protein
MGRQPPSLSKADAQYNKLRFIGSSPRHHSMGKDADRFDSTSHLN